MRVFLPEVLLSLILAKMLSLPFAREKITGGPRKCFDFPVCTESGIIFLAEDIKKDLWQFFHFPWLSCLREYSHWETGREIKAGGKPIHHLPSQ